MVDEAVPGAFVIHADGACWPNPGTASFGVVVRRTDGRLVCRLRKDIGLATNNIAEWRALAAAVDYLVVTPCVLAEIRMDSQLVVNQATLRWRVRDTNLRPIATHVLTRLAMLRSRGSVVVIKWVPRKMNMDADRLAARR